jgi:ABC-type long-subunit fatty acid transport system fused permease/ATPase subunit
MFILKQLFLFFTILNPVNKNYWENCGSKTDYLQDIKITYKPHTIHKETNLTENIKSKQTVMIKIINKFFVSLYIFKFINNYESYLFYGDM